MNEAVATKMALAADIIAALDSEDAFTAAAYDMHAILAAVGKGDDKGFSKAIINLATTLRRFSQDMQWVRPEQADDVEEMINLLEC